MNDLRTAAQQALEALEGGADSWQLIGPAIDALKEALVEDAMQKFTDVSQDIEAALAEPETCTWQQDGDSDSGFYGTSCKRYFDLNDGTPEDNKMAWCCYCGKKLAQKLITEDEDD